MVKRIRLLILIFFALLLFSVSISASGIEYGEEYEMFLSGIPEEVRQFLPSELFLGSEAELFETAEKMAEPSSFFEKLLKMLGFYIDDVLNMFAVLLAVVLLSALFGSLSASIANEKNRNIFSLCTCASSALIIIGNQGNIITSVKLFLERLLAFVNSMLPIIGVLYAAGGNVTTAAGSTASLGFFIAVCENLCVLTLMPIVGVCLAFSLSSVLGGISLGEISSAVKKMYTLGIGLLMSIFAIVMSLQNQLASKADSVGARAAKYAAGSMIPIVGNAVGDSLRTVAASVEYIRSAVGGISIAVILLMLLPTLLTLFFSRSALSLCSSISKMLGCERESRFFGEVGNVYGYMMAVSSICSVLFIYALTLFVRCTAAVGG